MESDTRHFEIDLTGWGLNYEVSIDRSRVADEIIRTIGVAGDDPALDESLRQASITGSSKLIYRVLLKAVAPGYKLYHIQRSVSGRRNGNTDTYLWGITLDRDPRLLDAAGIVDLLAKFQPRHPVRDSGHSSMPSMKVAAGDTAKVRFDRRTVPVFTEGTTVTLVIMVGPLGSPFRALYTPRRGKTVLLLSQHQHCNILSRRTGTVFSTTDFTRRDYRHATEGRAAQDAGKCRRTWKIALQGICLLHGSVMGYPVTATTRRQESDTNRGAEERKGLKELE